MTRPTGEDEMSSEHVEVLRHMKETIKAIMPSEVAALDAAIAALSAPQPPAEAQPVAHYCEHRHKCKWHADGAWPSFGTGEGREQAWKDAHAERCGGRILPLYARPTPSAPVGVEAVLRDALQGLIDFIEIDNLPMDADAMFIAKRALSQQPAAEGVQPEARGVVDEGSRSVTRQLLHWGGVPVHVTGTVTTSPGNWSLIDAALAAQPGGSDNDR